MANTDLSDINEIYLGYYLAGEKWFDKKAKQQVDSKREELNPNRLKIKWTRLKLWLKK